MVIPEKCKEWIRKQRTTGQTYQETIKHDFDLITPYLPDNCYDILDIGCGVGGINIFLSRFYNFVPQIHLFDFVNQQYQNKIKYGFNETYKGYNSKESTMEFMKQNGVKKAEYINADYGLSVRLSGMDIVISLLSMGYHYPIETYIDRIVLSMSAKGILIVDVRENTAGISTLKKYFKSVEIIATENKADKIIAKDIKW